METVRERLERMRRGETPAASVTVSGGNSVRDRLKKMQEDGERTAVQRETAPVEKPTGPVEKPQMVSDRRAGSFGGKSSGEVREGFDGLRLHGSRVSNTMTAAGKQYGGSMVNALGTALDNMGQQRRPEIHSDDPEKQAFIQAAAEQERKRQDGLVKSAGGLYQVADRLAESGQKDAEEAKRGLGSFGQFAVDVGVGGAQLAGDIGAGRLTGLGPMALMMVRSFGSAAQQARKDGASAQEAARYGLASAAVEAATEKLSSLGKFSTEAFGSGAVDDILNGVVGAVERLGKTEAGRAVLNRVASTGVGFLAEGFEEFISGIADPILQKASYGKEMPEIKETVADALYDFLVGGAIGAVSGGIGGTDTTGVQVENYENTVNRETDRAYQAMKEKGMFSQEGREEVRRAQEAISRARGPLAWEDVPPAGEIDQEGRETVSGQEKTAPAEAASSQQEAAGAEQPQQGKLAGRFKAAMEAEGASFMQAEQGSVILSRAAAGETVTPDQRAMVQTLPGGERLLETAERMGERAKAAPGFYARTIAGEERIALDRLAKAAGVYMEEIPGQTGAADGWIIGDRVYLSQQGEDARWAVAKHEVTHYLQEQAGEAYGRYRDYVAEIYRQEGSLETRLQEVQKLYRKAGKELTAAEAMDELAANYAGELLDNEALIRRLAGEDRTLGQRVLDAIRDLLRRLRAALGSQEVKQLDRAARLWEQALEETNRAYYQEGRRSGSAETRYALNPEFARQFDEWLANKSGNAGAGSFFVGTTSNALKSIGVSDYNIYWRKAKVAKIMKEHPAMTADVIKSVPRILESPVVVMQSQTVANRITMLGEATDADGYPVLVAVELSPRNKRGEVQDFAVIASAYGKGGVQRLIDQSNILFVEPDKKRTDTWLGLLGLQLPSSLTKYGSIDRVTLVERDVNGNLSFGPAIEKNSMRLAFEKAKERRAADGQDSRQSEKGPRETRYAFGGEKAALQEESADGTMGAARYSLKGLTEEEHGALLQYKSSESYKVNAKLRDGIALTEAEQTMVDELDRALEKLPCVEGVVYRTLSFDDMLNPEEEYEDFMSQHAEGVFARYKAYTSASTKTDGYPLPEKAKYGVTLEIKSQNAKDLSGFGNNFESEALFPRRSVFDVTRVTTDESGHTRIYMEEVQTNGGDKHQGHDPQERGVAVRDLQKAYSAHADLQSVPGADTRGDYGRRGNLQGEGETVDGQDSRQSAKGLRELQKQIDLLQRQNQRLRQEMKRTDAPRMNQTAVDKQAGELLKAYQSGYDRQKLAGELGRLYDGIANRSMLEEEMRSVAREIAENIVGESVAQTNPLYDEYADLRKILRTTAITLSPEHRADLDSLGGYSSVRKSLRGKVLLGNNGERVDDFYDSLSEQYPEFFPSDIYHPADQLERIVDVSEELQKVMGNPFAGTKAAEYLAGEILERYFTTPEARPTFADRQHAKRQADRAELREKYRGKTRDAWERGRLQEQRYYSRKLHQQGQKQEKQLRELRQKYREADRAMRQRRTETQLRDTIARHANRMAGKLLHPSDKQRIPEELRGSALSLLLSIDLGSNFTVNKATGERIYLKDMEEFQQMGSPTKRSQAAAQLRRELEELGGGKGLVVDEDLLDSLVKVAEWGDIPLADMGREQLDTLWDAMRALEAAITRADKLLTKGRYETVSQAADALAEENWARERKPRLPWLRDLEGLLSLDMLTPETFFHRLGKPGEEIYRTLREAKDRETTILSNMVERTEKIIREAGADPYALEKEQHQFTLKNRGEDGKEQTITLSVAQLMELYNLSRRKAALEHLYIGGIRPDVERVGRKVRERARAVHITPEDAAEMIAKLTPEQKALADKLRGELSTTLADYGNEASMQAYGYEKFREKEYWPIQVDSSETVSDEAKKARSKTIPGYGMAKALAPHAKNAVILHSAFDTYSKHIAQMATYAAWINAAQDVNRLWNFQFETGGTVKNIFNQVYGPGGNRYMEKLLGDIAAGTKAVGDTEFSMEGATRNFKSSAVGWNLRVILQQPTAILRAAELMDMKYLAAGMARRGGWEKAVRYAPIAKWKDWGYFEIGTGKSLKELMLGPGTPLEKLRGKSMEMAGKMDSVAWGALWNAVELETRDKRPDLQPDSQKFYETCAKRFSEIVDRTQVVDTVLHRTQAMRSGRDLYKMATSFMSEPSKIYNQVVRGMYDFSAAKNQEERKTAGKKLARTAVALTLSFAANAAAQAIPDAWRDDDRDNAYWEKLLAYWGKNFLESFNPVGYVPFIKDIQSVVKGYDVGRMDMNIFSKLINAAQQMKRAVDGEGKKSTLDAGVDLGLELCRSLGLPVANVKRDVLGIVGTALNGMGLYRQAYELDKLLFNLDSGSARGQFIGDLYRAMDQDWEDFLFIYNDLLEEGLTPENIKTGVENRMKEDLGVESVKSLPIRFSPPGEDKDFDRYMKEAEKAGEDWLDVLPEGSREAAALMEANKDAEKLERYDAIASSPWGEEVKEMALHSQMSESEFTKYLAAREAGVLTLAYVDFLKEAYRKAQKRTGKENASPAQTDVLDALEKSGISQAQKRAIWASYGWKTEYPG